MVVDTNYEGQYLYVFCLPDLRYLKCVYPLSITSMSNWYLRSTFRTSPTYVDFERLTCHNILFVSDH